MKAPIDLLDQLRCSSQIDLSGMDIHVAHIGCQPRKSCVDILSVPIPGQEPVNGKGVSEVVDAGAGVLAVMDSALPQQVPEGLVDGAVVQAAGSLVEEERGIERTWPHLQPFAHVLLKGLAGGSAYGHPACFSELAFCDIEHLLFAEEVLQVQGQRLTNPNPRAV